MLIIKNIFLSNSFARLTNRKFTQLCAYNFSGTLRVVRDTDTISQDQIDSILGNEPTHKNLQSIDSKDNQLAQKQLFYELIPKKNQRFPICIDPEEAYILETPNQNIMTALGMTVESSFTDYCNEMHSIWKQDQLYGSISPIPTINRQTLEFKSLLTVDSKYLQRLRGQFLVNLSIPGSIQAEDPRNFMELRPVQQFRHTPIIPIAESTMKKHKQKLEDYHRRQFVFEVKKESIYNFLLFLGAAGICGYMLYLILQKQEERTVAYTRLKYNRRHGIQQTPTFKI